MNYTLFEKDEHEMLYEVLNVSGGCQRLAKQLGITRGAVDKWKDSGKVPVGRLKEVAKITGFDPKIIRPDIWQIFT